MAWNPQQHYLQYQMQQWNSYAPRPNGMWNTPIFPGLLPGPNLNHTGMMYSMNGNRGLPHLGRYHTPALNKLVQQTLHLSQSEITPPLSPNDIEKHPYESLILTQPSLPLTPLSPPLSPPLDLNDKISTPTGLLSTQPPTLPFLLPGLGTTPIPFIKGRGRSEGPLLNQMEEIPTRDANGKRLPPWKIKRSFCLVHGCNKKFESRNKLQLHMYAHTGERPHMCEICGMRFARKFCYNRHLKSHTLIKPHKCTRCGRGFRESYDMETHLMTEVCLRKDLADAEKLVATPRGIEKTYTCKKCNAVFTSSNEFSTHMELHQPPSATTCHICRAKFCQKELVQQHIRENHPGYLDNQETKTEQLDPPEKQFNFGEQLAAFKEHPDIVYPELISIVSALTASDI